MSDKDFLVLYDYFSGAWPGLKKVVDEFFKDKPESIIRIPDKSGTVAVRKEKSGQDKMLALLQACFDDTEK